MRAWRLGVLAGIVIVGCKREDPAAACEALALAACECEDAACMQPYLDQLTTVCGDDVAAGHGPDAADRVRRARVKLETCKTVKDASPKPAPTRRPAAPVAPSSPTP